MLAEAVEKIEKKEKSTGKELLYFLFTPDLDIFAQTLHPQVKKERYLNLNPRGAQGVKK